MIADQIQTQIAIVGSGAGGAMVAQELARAGKDVVIIERGPDMSRFAGMEDLELGRNLYQEDGKYPKTREGFSILKGLNVGGTTELAIGHGVRSLEGEFRAMGIDLEQAFRETEDELGVNPMPKEHIGPNAGLLTDAAESLGMAITTWNKFIDFDLCTHCGRCVITCPTGAKWSANRVTGKLKTMENVFLLTETRVNSVNVSLGRASGVMCETSNGPLQINARTVILCAGGLGTPVILQNSGVKAGQSLFLDLFIIVYGRSSKFVMGLEPSMPTIFDEHKGRGYVLSPHVDVALMFQGLSGWFGDRPPYGIMVKTKDSNEGKVDEKGRVFKYLTANDRNNFSEGEKLAGDILRQAGVESDYITVSKPIGGHPGGTAAIGEVINPNLECKDIKGLYVCDASVFPTSPGLPPILTIASLAKWLGKSLII